MPNSATVESTDTTTFRSALRAISRSGRAGAGLPLRICFGDTCVYGLVKNFSCSGMFVRVPELAAIDTVCRVHMPFQQVGC